MDKDADIKKRFKVLFPQELNKREKGKFWEDLVAPLFSLQRWEIIQDIQFEGMQIDIYIRNIDTSETGLVECKFQIDPIDTGTLYKLIGQADSKKVQYAYLVSTSGLTSDAKATAENYHNERFKLVVWSSDTLAQVFMDIKKITIPELNQSGIGRVETITLLVTPKKDFFWIAEEIGENGQPSRVLIFPISDHYSSHSPDEWKKYFQKYRLSWASLTITVFNKIGDQENQYSYSQLSSELEKLTISKINEADSFDDYHRPCRPQDFFGRLEIQTQFWNFVKNVKDRKTDLRVICFSGNTGVGKSSLVLKLTADCLQKKEYKDEFYIYHVDVTSVNPKKANLFVASAIRKALQEAIDTGFIELPNHQIVIQSTEPPFLSSHSIELVIEYLNQTNKVVIIFFDQFEEILIKESLFPLYELFKIAAYEIDAIKKNIILGFCWRTDIYLPAKSQAYYVWHELERIRKDIEFGEFSSQDSESLLNGFNKYLTQKGKKIPPIIKN